ncbi:MAG TPA: response regulator [Verrucomicrobiae bacterium]|nr:response regulator [Verrucomicrobiae bacterium]
MNSDFTILIAEDLENDVVLLKMALQREGIHNPIQVVQDGKEAIDYLCGHGIYADRNKYPFPRLLFCDLKMPRMGGFEILKWLRSHSECSIIPVIILTASGQDEDVRRAYQMGANAYLVKPAKIGDLQKMVKTAFEFWAWCAIPSIAGNC